MNTLEYLKARLAKESERAKAIKAKTLDPYSAHPDDTAVRVLRWKAAAARVNLLEDMIYDLEHPEQ